MIYYRHMDRCIRLFKYVHSQKCHLYVEALCRPFIWGDITIPHSRMTKTCWGNSSDLFVIYMRQVTKGHLYHLMGVSGYYIMYRQRAKSVL